MEQGSPMDDHNVFLQLQISKFPHILKNLPIEILAVVETWLEVYLQ